VATGRGVERLKKLCAVLDKNGNAQLGWWTRMGDAKVACSCSALPGRLFLCFFQRSGIRPLPHSEGTKYPEDPEDTLINTLIPIIHHTPNPLHIIFELRMSAPTFHHIADALVKMCARALHTVYWCVGGSEGGAKEKVVWAPPPQPALAPTPDNHPSAIFTSVGIFDRTQNNWIQWKDDMIGTFQCYDLYGHLTGSIARPNALADPVSARYWDKVNVNILGF
jgi:hypothetical protein